MSNEVRTTRYTTKSNVETTRYFNSSYADVVEQVEQNTQDITDIKTRLTTDETNISNNTINISNNTTDISNNTTDITDIKTRLTTDETNISTNTTNISTNTTNISNLDSRVSVNETNIEYLMNHIGNDNPYEGDYYSIYYDDGGDNKGMIVFNYDKGRLLYWNEGAALWRCSVNDKNIENLLSEYVTELSLPSHVKRLNEDGSVNCVMYKLEYLIEATTGRNDRKLLSELKTLTIPQGVIYRIFIDIQPIPSIQCINLAEGLEEFVLNGDTTGSCPNQLDYLCIPASVSLCNIKNFNIYTLRIEGTETRMKLRLINIQIIDELYIHRKYFNTSGNNSAVTGSASTVPPAVINCHRNFVSEFLTINTILGSKNNENLSTTTTLIIHARPSDAAPSAQGSISFKRIINMTPYSSSSFQNISTSNWVGG